MAPNNLPLLQSLWSELAQGLLGRLKATKRASVDLLSVTRRFLRDNSVSCPSDAEMERLQDLYMVYSNRLSEAMAQPHPSASTLTEARKWLEWHGIRADIPKHQAVQVAAKLGDGSLPFAVPKQHH